MRVERRGSVDGHKVVVLPGSRRGSAIECLAQAYQPVALCYNLGASPDLATTRQREFHVLAQGRPCSCNLTPRVPELCHGPDVGLDHNRRTAQGARQEREPPCIDQLARRSLRETTLPFDRIADEALMPDIALQLRCSACGAGPEDIETRPDFTGRQFDETAAVRPSEASEA